MKLIQASKEEVKKKEQEVETLSAEMNRLKEAATKENEKVKELASRRGELEKALADAREDALKREEEMKAVVEEMDGVKEQLG